MTQNNEKLNLPNDRKQTIIEKPSNLSLFRTSYSILNAWSRGNYSDAIDMFFKKEKELSSYLKDGIDFHKKWEYQIKQTKQLPKELDRKETKLKNPQCELKLEIPINDHIEFVGVIDCLDEDILYEFKSGSMSSADYANGLQVDCYSYLLSRCGYNPIKGMYLHYDQYVSKTDKSLVYLTDTRRQKAKEWIEKQSESMYQYFIKNNLPLISPKKLYIIEVAQ